MELERHTEKIAVGSEFRIEASAEFSLLLEYYFSKLLANQFSEWKSESLDGVLVSGAHKAGEGIVELSGLALLISDQTFTPFFARLAFGPPYNSIVSCQMCLGEAGGGRLGISGPPYGSLRAEKLLESVKTRLDSILWKYRVTTHSG